MLPEVAMRECQARILSTTVYQSHSDIEIGVGRQRLAHYYVTHQIRRCIRSVSD